MSSEPLLAERGENWDLGSNCTFNFQQEEGVYLLPELSVEPKKASIAADGERWRKTWIARWSRKKVVDPFVVILRRGLEPQLLALSAALGLTIGIFPVCGFTLAICALVAVLLRSNCHVPTLMLANFLISPFELGLVVPFLRVGELVTGGQQFPLSSGGLWKAITDNGPHTVMFGILHAVIGWSICAPFLVGISYISFLPVFRFLVLKFRPNHVLQPPSSVKQENARLLQYASV